MSIKKISLGLQKKIDEYCNAYADINLRVTLVDHPEKKTVSLYTEASCRDSLTKITNKLRQLLKEFF